MLDKTYFDGLRYVHGLPDPPRPMNADQRQVLTDRLYAAALENTRKATDPPPSELAGGYPSAAAKAHGEAARALVQALMTVVNPGGRR